jgi:hypothetical protein
MNKLKTFARLSRNDRMLLLQAFAYLTSCKIRLRIQRFEQLQAWATERGHGAVAVGRLSWAVNVALRLMPGSTCLCQALALQRLLARNGHDSELRIGVKKSNDNFGAHAWLVHDGEILIGGSMPDHYEPLVALKSRNEMASSASSDSRTA